MMWKYSEPERGKKCIIMGSDAMKLRFFEDYVVGQQGVTGERTVTEADVVSFACITGDYSLAHLNRHRMRDSIYGERVAHGLLGSSMAIGMLSYDVPHLIGRGIPAAYVKSIDFNYRKGIKLGDTINVHWYIAEKMDEALLQGCGLIRISCQIVNQDGVAVYDGSVTIIVARKSASNMRLKLEPVASTWKVNEFIPDPTKVYYSEDYPIGCGADTDGRTITETDIVNFAGLTGDYNPQYVDAEFAKGSAFGERCAHGMLIFSSAFGLWVTDWHKFKLPETKSALAGHLNDKATFLSPVKIGDTIRCKWKVLDNTPSRTRPEVGIVKFGLEVVNQRNQVVVDGSTVIMMGSKKPRFEA
jgi:acyl dehydratase